MSDVVIRLRHLGKMYRLYHRTVDKALDAFGLSRLLFWRRDYYQEFWALRDVSLDIRRGERVGIIGHNGAGKTTLLRIMTGNLSPSGGEVTVHGRVQALLEVGTGFHPEFTGEQNIYAFLAYQGLSASAARAKHDEIVEFSELGDFIHQPVKTYSAGMYARLAFSTAISIDPDILIIDEVLGAGDAYFASKCADHIRELMGSGATLVLVSHSMVQVLQFCERVIWVDRGKIVMDGPALDVTNAYERDVRIRTERRLAAKNLKLALGGYDKHELDHYSDAILLRFTASDGEAGGFCLQRVTLLQNEEEIEDLWVGEAQDMDSSHPSWVVVGKGSYWASPVSLKNGGWGRGLLPRDGANAQASAAFHLYVYDANDKYAFRLQFVPPEKAPVRVEVYDGEQYVPLAELASKPEGAVTEMLVQLPPLKRRGDEAQKKSGARWPGATQLLIKRVLLLDETGRQRAVFNAGERLTLKMVFCAEKDGTYPARFCAVLYRADGTRVSCHLSEEMVLDMSAGEEDSIELHFGDLNLGNGTYVFGVGVYSEFDEELRREPKAYDLHGMNYEFQVTGRSASDAAVFHHPATWRLPQTTTE